MNISKHIDWLMALIGAIFGLVVGILVERNNAKSGTIEFPTSFPIGEDNGDDVVRDAND